MYIPEPALNPPEYPTVPLRCCLCSRRVPQALRLYYGIVCRECLLRCLSGNPLEEAAALLCAELLEDPTPLNDFNMTYEEEAENEETGTHARSLPGL